MKKLSVIFKEHFPFVTAFILGTIGFGIGILSDYSRDAFYIAIFSLVLIFILILAKVITKPSIRVSLIFLAAFILTHFIIFPLWYVSILKNDLKSITINQEVLFISKSDAIKELDEYYSPEKLKYSSELLSHILSDSNLMLDTTIGYLENYNILVLDSFIIVRNDSIGGIRVDVPAPLENNNCILICNKDGFKLTKLYESDLTKFVSKKISIRNYLSALKEFYIKNANTYSNKKEIVVEGKGLWTYTRILPYSLDIFNADNFRPVSPKANVVHFIHNIIVWMLILPMLGSFLYGLIVAKKEH